MTLSESKLAGWISLGISIVGLLSHPEVLNILPENFAAAISVIGIILQALSKSVVKDA